MEQEKGGSIRRASLPIKDRETADTRCAWQIECCKAGSSGAVMSGKLPSSNTICLSLRDMNSPTVVVELIANTDIKDTGCLFELVDSRFTRKQNRKGGKPM